MVRAVKKSAARALIHPVYQGRYRAAISYMRLHSGLFYDYHKELAAAMNSFLKLAAGTPEDFARYCRSQLRIRARMCQYAYRRGNTLCRLAAQGGSLFPSPLSASQETLLELGQLRGQPEYYRCTCRLREAGNRLRGSAALSIGDVQAKFLFDGLHGAFSQLNDLYMLYFGIIGYLDALPHLGCPENTAFTREFIQKMAL